MLKEEIQKFFKGEVLNDESTLKTYSKDASLFEVEPKLVVYPKDARDLENLVKYVSENKSEQPELSITIRAAGTDMSGGPLNESIIADVTHHLNKVGKVGRETVVGPGAYYRDFEKKTLEKGLILPCYTASKDLCALGGMFGNNAAGEKSLRYGKMENFVAASKVIFADGNEYEVKPLSRAELMAKMRQEDFEGNLYRKLFNLIESNEDLIRKSKPKVSKNSAGYYLWNIWDGRTFDLNKLLVGSQGTLGIVTEMRLKLVPVEPVSKLFVIFLPNLKRIAEIVNAILPTKPESIESYDDATLKLAIKFSGEMFKVMRAKNFFKLLLSFIPEAFMILRGGWPKLVVLVEYAGKTDEEVDAKLFGLEAVLKPFELVSRRCVSEEESNKYWTVRRESFNLLRKHVKNARTAPFIDDVVVPPKHMPEFLPRMREILDSYKLTYTIAGHAGNGNFHIIPLMDMHIKDNVRVIEEVSDKVYNLIGEFNGSITGEHNDGIVRTPYLNKMYSREVLELFKQVKQIFDPKNIFNPGKKVGSSLEYLSSHIAIE